MTTASYTAAPRPKRGTWYGITHQPAGGLIIREPKLLKVSIGAPKGPAVYFFITPDGKWNARVGYDARENKSQVHKFADRKEAETFYRQGKFPACPSPRKLAFFTFSRMNADGLFDPDWDAIEAHGPAPTEIDIVFLSDDAFDGGYQMWSASELQCRGDGINAERIVKIAGNVAPNGARPTEEILSAARIAKDAGDKFFPIEDGCWTMGCPYATGDPTPCKPGGDLKFQLANNLRVGGTAYFHTTGRRSISQLFSALYQFRCITGGGDPDRGTISGFPLKLVLRPFKTNHNGQPGKAYGVHLEFHASSVAGLRKRMIEQAMEFRGSMSVGAAPRMIEAPENEGIELEDPETGEIAIATAGPGPETAETEQATATAMTNEFYPEQADGQVETSSAASGAVGAPDVPVTEAAVTGTGSATAEQATGSKTEALREKVRRQRRPAEEVAGTRAGTPTGTPAGPAQSAAPAAAESGPVLVQSAAPAQSQAAPAAPVTRANDLF